MKKPPFTKPTMLTWHARWNKWAAGLQSLRHRSVQARTRKDGAPQAVRNSPVKSVRPATQEVHSPVGVKSARQPWQQLTRRFSKHSPQAVRKSKSVTRTVTNSAKTLWQNAAPTIKLPKSSRVNNALKTVKLLRMLNRLRALPVIRNIPPRTLFRVYQTFRAIYLRAIKTWQFICALPLRLILLVSLIFIPSTLSAVNTVQRATWDITPQKIAAAITPAIADYQFPSHITFPDFPIDGELRVEYTLDQALQNRAQRLLKRYRPDYGIFVALDADTGRVLAMASRTRNPVSGENLTMRNSYPAASISKIITAVAALDENKMAADTIIPFNGKATSLYKKNVFKHRDHRWTRRYTFERAFARSVNSVFGRVGAVEVGGTSMLDYAQRLGFNQKFDSDLNFGNGKVRVDPSDDWQIAEMASGYTLRNTLSPLHAAALAASTVNGGELVTPVVVQSITGPNGVPLYWHESPEKSKVMSDETAHTLKKMMRATVKSGSARGSFRKLGRLKDVIIGGKTGSLTGLNPRGKYDWFVGFAEHDGRKIAFASLCINKERWYVKSPQLARELLDFYFRAPAT